MQRNNTYDIAKCWAIVSVIVYHVINIIFYNQRGCKLNCVSKE